MSARTYSKQTKRVQDTSSVLGGHLPAAPWHPTRERSNTSMKKLPQFLQSMQIGTTYDCRAHVEVKHGQGWTDRGRRAVGNGGYSAEIVTEGENQLTCRPVGDVGEDDGDGDDGNDTPREDGTREDGGGSADGAEEEEEEAPAGEWVNVEKTNNLGKGDWVRKKDDHVAYGTLTGPQAGGWFSFNLWGKEGEDSLVKVQGSEMIQRWTGTNPPPSD